MIGHLAHFFQRRNTILVIQAGAVLLLVSSVLAWVRISGAGSTVTLSGAEMSTLVRTVGVIAVGGGVLITLARRWVRGALAAVLLGGGVISLIAAGLALIDPAAAAARRCPDSEPRDRTTPSGSVCGPDWPAAWC